MEANDAVLAAHSCIDRFSFPFLFFFQKYIKNLRQHRALNESSAFKDAGQRYQNTNRGHNADASRVFPELLPPLCYRSSTFLSEPVEVLGENLGLHDIRFHSAKECNNIEATTVSLAAIFQGKPRTSGPFYHDFRHCFCLCANGGCCE